MLFIFLTPVILSHLWQLKTVVFPHRCLICTLPLTFAIQKVHKRLTPFWNPCEKLNKILFDVTISAKN